MEKVVRFNVIPNPNHNGVFMMMSRDVKNPIGGRCIYDLQTTALDGCAQNQEAAMTVNKLCVYTGLERLPSGNGLTLSSCCHEDSDVNLHAICEIENQKKCCDCELGDQS